MANLVTNGNFTGNANSWTLAASWSYNNNNVIHSIGYGSAVDNRISQNITVEDGISYTPVAVVGGTVGTVTIGFVTTSSFVGFTAAAGSGLTDLGAVLSEVGANHITAIRIEGSTDFDGTIDEVRVERYYPDLPVYNPSIASALKKVEQGLSFPQFIFGGQGGASGAEYKLFKRSTTYGFHIIRIWHPNFNVGREFDVQEIKLPIIPGIQDNMEIVPILRFDNESSSSAGKVIDATRFPNEENLITLLPTDFPDGIHGNFNFYLELQITGTDLAVVALPINVELEIYDK